MAANRTPVKSQIRTASISFLGADTAFSRGPNVLAALMVSLVYVLFCLREG